MNKDYRRSVARNFIGAHGPDADLLGLHPDPDNGLQGGFLLVGHYELDVIWWAPSDPESKTVLVHEVSLDSILSVMDRPHRATPKRVWLTLQHWGSTHLGADSKKFLASDVHRLLGTLQASILPDEVLK